VISSAMTTKSATTICGLRTTFHCGHLCKEYQLQPHLVQICQIIPVISHHILQWESTNKPVSYIRHVAEHRAAEDRPHVASHCHGASWRENSLQRGSRCSHADYRYRRVRTAADAGEGAGLTARARARAKARVRASCEGEGRRREDTKDSNETVQNQGGQRTAA